MLKKTGWSFTLFGLILAGCLYFLFTGKFNLGIDLRGGTELTYLLDLSRVDDKAGGQTAAEQIKTVVANRLDIYGLKEISISVEGSDRLVVQFPGASDSQEVDNLKRQVEQAGRLEFMLAAPDSEQTPARIAEVVEEEQKYLAADRVWFAAKKKFEEKYLAERTTPPEFSEKRPDEPEFIARPEVFSEEVGGRSKIIEKPQNQWGNRLTVLHNREPFKVSGAYLSRSSMTYDENGRPAVSFGFNPEGAGKFAEMTGPNKGRSLAIVLDSNIREVANIKSRIYDQGQLSGNFTQADVRRIVTLLKGGSLPTKPQLISETTVGAVLGHDSIRNGSIAVGVGLFGVLAFMATYYFLGGMVANIALIFNIIIILAYVMVFRQTLTFPGIAGILLTIGMAVDANILIFERVREELGKGKSLLHALTTGYQRAFWVIFDTHVTTILSGVVLFNAGSGPVKGFAVTLIAGLVASFFTSVYVTRAIFSFMINIGFMKRLRMLKIFSPPRVDFIGHRRVFIGATVGIIVLTWVIFVIPRGSGNYGIDFTGGTRIAMNLNKVIAADELQDLLTRLPPHEKELFKDPTIQTLNSKEGSQASRFTLLIRSDASPSIAHAQEKNEPASGAPAAAPAPTTAAPTAPTAPAPAPVTPAAPAPEEKKAVSPPAAPAAGSPAPPSLPAEKAAAPAVATAPPRLDMRTQEARRVEVLKEMLRRASLLLPEAFSEPAWKDAGSPGTQQLVLDVNLVLPIAPDFSKPGLSTPEVMRQKLNEYIDARPPIASFKGPPGTFKWVQLQGVELIPAPVNAAAGEGAVQINSFRITTAPYAEPPATADDTLREAPRHSEVVGLIKSFFRDSKQLTISEPIPEVISVGPKVAANLQASAVIAVFIAMLGIMFYMALRFEFMYGVGGAVSLIHDVLITIGIMAMTDTLIGRTFSLKINLPELAAFLTIIGFSINDTIVIFDRVREMLKTMKRKVEFSELINAAVNQTLSRTIWTSITTLIVTLALLLFGGEPVRGFSFAFAVGIVTGTYSSIFIASPVVLWMHNRQVRRRQEILEEETAKA